MVIVCLGTDTAKEAADVVMLDKDLATVCEGVLIGRKTYGNTIKCALFSCPSSFDFLCNTGQCAADRAHRRAGIYRREACAQCSLVQSGPWQHHLGTLRLIL